MVQDVSTRWNSAYYMAERLLSQQQPVCATLLELHKGDMMPTDDIRIVCQGYETAS